MPSASRPFTPELVTRLVASGIQVAPLLLHTGVASLEDHEPPYEEFYRVPPETADCVNAAKSAGHRVVVAARQSCALSRPSPTSGTVSWRGMDQSRDWSRRPLRSVNGMITGFHEPQATHLAMVEQVIVAAGGRSLFHLLRAYREAQEAGTCGTSSVTHTRSLAVEAGLKTRLCATSGSAISQPPSTVRPLSAEPRTCGR